MAPLKEIVNYPSEHVMKAFGELSDEIKYAMSNSVRVNADDLRTILHAFVALQEEVSQLIEFKHADTRDIGYEMRQRQAISKSLGMKL